MIISSKSFKVHNKFYRGKYFLHHPLFLYTHCPARIRISHITLTNEFNYPIHFLLWKFFSRATMIFVHLYSFQVLGCQTLNNLYFFCWALAADDQLSFSNFSSEIAWLRKPIHFVKMVLWFPLILLLILLYPMLLVFSCLMMMKLETSEIS